MGQYKPPSTLATSMPRLFRIGKDSHGNWVAQDQQGLCGGLFVDRADALRFAMFENGNCPQAVIMVPGVLELDMTSKQSQGLPRAGASAKTAHARAA
jgi:hypothetical protein